MARDHVLSLRLDDGEHRRLLGRVGTAQLSDAVRQMLLEHIDEPPTCGVLKLGTWAGGYLPVCALPRHHSPLQHWWRHDSSRRVETW